MALQWIPNHEKIRQVLHIVVSTAFAQLCCGDPEAREKEEAEGLEVEFNEEDAKY